MRRQITLATGEFEDLVALGLERLITGQDNLRLVARDIRWEMLAPALVDHAPAVLILNFGSLPSLAALRELLADHDGTRVVVLANRPSSSECNQMLSFGVSACIPKETQARDVVNAIHLASRGMHVVPRPVERMTAELRDFAGPELLTAREADVLELLQGGRTNAQIAQSLSIGLETVRTHARHIYAKLGVASRRELAVLTRGGR